MSDTVEERISVMMDTNTGENLSWIETERDERGDDEILRRTIGL
jgi:hypothetical protein